MDVDGMAYAPIWLRQVAPRNILVVCWCWTQCVLMTCIAENNVG